VIYAVKAMDELKQRGKIDAFHLVIIGDGKEKENLKAYVEEKGLSPWVEFKGRIPHDQVDQYYKATSVLLMPSTKSDDVEEATSLSMLEGLICAKPVIASKIGGLKEVIEDGENGLLVDDKCPDQIADRLLFLLTNPQEAEALSQRAYEIHQKKSRLRESRFKNS
jgi:glycosyltransferase involved in cell wall biosynthesis